MQDVCIGRDSWILAYTITKTDLKKDTKPGRVSRISLFGDF